MTAPVVYGADYSCYVRIVRLALTEKGVDYELVPVDVFAPDGLPDWYRELHPFGRIPAFRHGELTLFETSAIARYVDEAFDGPALQPAEVGARATMNQIIAMLDAYAYRPLVWHIYVERVAVPREGGVTDERKIAEALPVARTCLATLTGLKRPGRWLLGEQLTLADLHAAPMIAFFLKTPEGHAMMQDFDAISAWWQAMSARDSFGASEQTG